MATLRLDERRVDTLKPRKSAYDVRDRELKSFGVRVLPSGAKRYFIHSQHHGPAGLEDRRSGPGPSARTRLAPGPRPLLAAIREGNDGPAAAPPDTAFETVGEEVFRRYARNWKTSTLQVNRGHYRNHILPWFKGRPIDDITSRDVSRWFASLHETPVAADRSAPILSVIMRQAEVYGYRPEGTNPCAGIKRYRPPGAGTLPVGGGDRPTGRRAGAPRSRPPAGLGGHTTAVAHWVPQGRARHPEMALLPRGQVVPAR